MSLDSIKLLFELQRYTEALNTISKTEDHNVLCSLFEVLIYAEMGDINSAISSFNQINIEGNSDLERYATKATLLRLHYRSGDYENLKKEIPVFENTPIDSINLEYVYWQEKGIATIGMYYHLTGRLDLAHDIFIQTMQMNKILNNQNAISRTLVNLGEIHLDKEDYDSAVKYLNESMKLSKEIGNFMILAYSHYNLGRIFKIRGETGKAIDHLTSALPLFSEVGKITGHIISMIELGEIYTRRGELALARKYLSRSLEMSLEHDVPSYIAESYHRLGLLEFNEQQIENGINHLKISVETWKKLGNKNQVANVLFDLVSSLVSSNSLNDANEYNTELQSIVKQLNLPTLHQQAKLAIAMIHKSKTRLREKVKAQSILEDLLQGEIQSVYLKLTTLLEMIDIKIFELKTFEDKSIVEEIEDYVNRIWVISKDEDMVPVMIELLFLRSKLSLVKGEFGLTSDLITQALHLVEASGLAHLTKRILQIRDEVFIEIEKWQRVASSGSNIRERIEETDLKGYLQDVANAIRDQKLGKVE